MDPQHHAKHEAEPDLDPPDRELIDRVRDGDLEAFDPLYRRHRESGMRHARHWTRSEAGAEDLCAEAFTRVLYAIRNGNGPTEAFRPYLLTAMRNVARDWAEGDRRTLLVPDLVDVAPPEPDGERGYRVACRVEGEVMTGGGARELDGPGERSHHW